MLPLVESAKVFPGVEAGAVAIGPGGLEGVTADGLEGSELEAFGVVFDLRFDEASEDIGFAAAGGAGTGAAEGFEGEIAFLAV